MSKVLVITDSIDIDDSSGSKANVAFIHSLMLNGHDIRVLHYTRKDIHLEGIECMSIKELKFNLNYFLSRFQRIIQRFTKLDFSTFLENLFGNSFTFFNDSFSISRAIKAYHRNDDLIITLSKAASFRPHYAMLRNKNLHTKWLAYVHDPYPMQYYPHPYTEKTKGFKFKAKFFQNVSEKAKFSGFPSKLLIDWMGQFFPNFLKTGIVIPHQKLPKNQSVEGVTLPAYFNTQSFTVVYAGSLLSQRNPEYLIKAFQLFLKNNESAFEDASLIFIGNANKHKAVLLNNESKNISWSKGYLPYLEVEKIQNLASVNVILETDTDISPFLPGKFPHLVESNRIILYLGPDNSESVRLLGKDYPYKSEVTDVEQISKAISKLYNSWKENKQIKLDRQDLNDYFHTNFFNNQLNTLN